MTEEELREHTARLNEDLAENLKENRAKEVEAYERSLLRRDHGADAHARAACEMNERSREEAERSKRDRNANLLFAALLAPEDSLIVSLLGTRMVLKHDLENDESPREDLLFEEARDLISKIFTVEEA